MGLGGLKNISDAISATGIQTVHKRGAYGRSNVRWRSTISTGTQEGPWEGLGVEQVLWVKGALKIDPRVACEGWLGQSLCQATGGRHGGSTDREAEDSAERIPCVFG